MPDATLVRTLDADPERVWRAWVDPDDLVGWFWPGRFESVASLDPRPDGRWSIASQVAGMGASGKYLTVEPGRRLVFTWRWDGEPEETTVAVELVPAGASTELRLTQTGFATAEAAADHEQGWSDCLARLPDHLA